MRKRRIAKYTLYGLVLFIAIAIAALHAMEDYLHNPHVPGVDRDTVETETPWTVSYLRAGGAEKQRIIYIHGTPGNATAFEEYLTDPIPGFESISLDRPGFGKTRPLRPAVALANQAAAIERLLVKRDGEWPILVGHSMGGPIAAQVAVEYPDKVGGLVILSGAMDPDLEKVYWYQHVATFGFIPYLLPRSLRNANTEVIPLKEELAKLKPRLGDIECPVSIVHAPDDVLVPFENVAFMKEAIPDERIAKVVVLEGKNHFVPWNAEEAVREVIERLAEAKPRR